MLIEQLVLIFVLLLLGITLYNAQVLKSRYNSSLISEFTGLCTSFYDAPSLREKNLEKILDLLAEHGELQNEDIRKYLNVSDRTVVRYMDTLEDRGQVEQVGDTGRSVTYKKRL